MQGCSLLILVCTDNVVQILIWYQILDKLDGSRLAKNNTLVCCSRRNVSNRKFIIFFMSLFRHVIHNFFFQAHEFRGFLFFVLLLLLLLIEIGILKDCRLADLALMLVFVGVAAYGEFV